MPFKSKSQHRFFRAAEARNELPKGTAKRWAEHTPSIKSLPEKVKTTVNKDTTSKTASASSLPPNPVPRPVAPSPIHQAVEGFLSALNSKSAAHAAWVAEIQQYLGDPALNWKFGELLKEGFAPPPLPQAQALTNQFISAPQTKAPTRPVQPSGPKSKSPALPGVPGHAATNVIDKNGPIGGTVDGNNAAIRKMAEAWLATFR